MYKQEVKKLYHYQSMELKVSDDSEIKNRGLSVDNGLILDQYKLKPLLLGLAYYAKPEQFNDPFEADFDISIDDLCVETLIQLLPFTQQDELPTPFHPEVLGSFPDESIRSAFAVITPELKDMVQTVFINSMRQQAGLYCLSAKPNDTIMWAHYGDCHRGIALEFEREEESHCGNMCFEVEYFEKPPVIKFGALVKEIIQAIGAGSLNEKGKLFENAELRKLVFSKTENWRYEEEWRVSHFPGLQDMPGKLTGIVFGANADERLIAYLTSLDQLKGVEFKFLVPKNYQLELVSEQEFKIARVIKDIDPTPSLISSCR
ncbi:DUF2971 domain-containing protein [Vibrio sp. 10N.261.51.F12]|uniref:DUF2971 domain-containing protein n=1 Tax=Vibrio sp. 10N.261.51.F12 TaxID=3229679 RepID=UPI0035512A18